MIINMTQREEWKGRTCLGTSRKDNFEGGWELWSQNLYTNAPMKETNDKGGRCDILESARFGMEFTMGTC